jgi:hypothetical protein
MATMTSEPDLVHEIAGRILAGDPDPVVRFRLLRDVLARPPDSPELAQAQRDLSTSRWVRELEREQREDGSWGRFHSRDSQARRKIPTTEVGVERALALGLDVSHPILSKAARYLVGLIEGPLADFPDPPEKNDRWPTGVQLFTAATLALVQPDHPVLDEVWNLWLSIAQRTFAGGRYDARAEIQAHRELTGATVRDSYLVLSGKYQLALLGARPGVLPRDMAKALLDWVWHKEDGIGYLGVRLFSPDDYLNTWNLDRWLVSLGLLSHFPGWREQAGDAIRWLWDRRTPAGLWDFGPKTSVRLSETWRKEPARQFDWTTQVLVLLQHYYVPTATGRSGPG